MERTKKAHFGYRDVFYPRIAVVADQATAARRLAPGVIVVVSAADKMKMLRFLCPCGCGETITVNLVEGVSKAWDVSFRPNRGLSLWPSVWLDVGCKSHFILRDNTARLLWGRFPKMTKQEEESWWATLPIQAPAQSRDGIDTTV
jgi:hypothetical protein